jgi:uncharacterized membrane-anchored protein YitT (DUF2179 family)
MKAKLKHKSLKNYLLSYTGITIGCLLAAISIRVFLYPNQLIDGGVIGISLIFARLFGEVYLSWFMLIFNLPFIYLAYKFIRKTFVVQMAAAVLIFALFLFLTRSLPPFIGEPLEIIAFGGALLGAGVGLIIKNGSCTDGTEILAIIINKKMGFTIGQTVLFVNFFIFAAYGLIFQDWHIALKSLLTYIVAFKMIDIVLAGIEELKSVLIMTSIPQKIKKIITEELGLGLTILQGKGGFSGEDKEILFIIVERLDLAALKEIVLREDPSAFMAIENLHEVAYGKHVSRLSQKDPNKKRKSYLKKS